MADESTHDDGHLADGWELDRDTPPTDTVHRAQVHNLAERYRFAAKAGAPALDDGDLVGALKTEAGPWGNDVVALRPFGDEAVSALVDRVAAFADRPAMLWCAWPAPDLSAHGFTLMGHPPGMVRAPGGEAPPVPDALRVVEADNDDAMTDYDRTCTLGFPVNAQDGSPLYGIITPELRGGPWRFFVGYEGDEPVTVASVFVGAGVAQVEYVATMPDHRGKGYGEGVTWAATMAEPELPAVLIASDLGRPVYERMGYLPYTRFTLWHWPGQRASA